VIAHQLATGAVSPGAINTGAINTGTHASLTQGPFLWYANRGTGVVLVGLLTLSVAIGVLSTVRAGTPAWPRFATQALHRNISLIAAALLVVHVTTAVVDTFVDIRWYDAIIPFHGSYKPYWLGLGAIALDIIAVVIITSLLRYRLGHRGWRGIHLLTYFAWGVGVFHGIGIGTDSTTAWEAGVTAVCIGVVTLALVIRMATWSHERRLAA